MLAYCAQCGENGMTKEQELQRQVNALRQKLDHEVNLRKALELHVQRPVNFHRWRCETNGSETATAYQKLSCMNQQLVRKCVEIKQKDEEIAKLNQANKELQQSLLRRNQQAEEILDANKRDVKKLEGLQAAAKSDKQTQIELLAVQARCQQQQSEISRLRDELAGVRRCLYDLSNAAETIE